MNSEGKVFTSDIIRVNNKLKNNLYDVINIVPAKPLAANTVNDGNCSFVPRSDKYYVSKKKNGVKVKTVRDIRNMFEKDVCSYLPDELEKQKSLLMHKIRGGSSKEEETRQIAKNILNNDSPVTRQVWQMIMNINPLDCKFSSRYIIWNGRIIQVSGSKAGKKKFISNYDIGKDKNCSLFKPISKRPLISKRKGLLHNSLNVKFRPGPLTRKKYLDTSYQKYQFGDMELVNLPKPGLDIQPTLGKTLAPKINTFLQNTFSLDSDGKISKKWADFAVSVLGNVKNGTASQITEGCAITFNLNYKCLQHRLLMRHDSDITTDFQDDVSISNVQIAEEESTILSQVKNIMKDILNSVEISLNQDDLYFGEDEPRDNLSSKNLVPNCYSKERTKRKCTELDRLDVTVIRISDNLDSSKTNKCYNAFCTLGCVCESLRCTFNLKRHCGRLECMFNCKCDFSKYKLMDSIDSDCSDIIPGLVNLDKKLGLRLAKEEQKFHQTVIMTEEKSIHLKSQRRNWKTSKKYAEFYSTMRLKAACNGTKILSIACINLDCKDVEPWCMVHNLYKCFCKGKFTESFNHSTDEIKVSQNENENDNGPPPTSKLGNDDVVQINDLTVDNNNLLNLRSHLRPRVFRSDKTIKTACPSETNYSKVIPSYFYGSSCSRINSYKGRKYDALYYQKTNQKILVMERNDKKIHKRLMDLINKDDKTKLSSTSQNEEKPIDNTNNTTSATNPASSLDELLTNVIENSPADDCIVTTPKSDTTIKPNEKRLPNKTKLVAWLETSYKQYKETPEKSFIKLSLDPPKSGKVALYPWEFVLSRYRERKNYFLLTKQKPFRIFMAVDIKNSFFENCINISDIALSELDKYPITVKNLLTNASDLKDNFCILNGLSFCWELVGSVAKVHEKSDGLKKTDENKDTTKLMLPLEKSVSLNQSLDQLDSNTPTVNIDESDTENDTIEDFRSPQIEENIELSKWFVMTLETDFTEIRFYNKGFFVKYDSVIKAINVARLSGKTVRLSSQRCNTAQSDPQFGIYAIPTKEDYCVFIGPYEENERLGIETVKNIATRKKKKSTRGIWITTNKLDNLNVIDNPLLYMPSNSSELDKIVTLDSGYKAAIINDSGTSNVLNDNIEEIPVKKGVKPIKLRKSGFYNLSSKNLLKRLPAEKSEAATSNRQPIILNKPIIISKLKTTSTSVSTPKISFDSNSLQDKNNEFNKSTIVNKPIAEIAPQLKETIKVQTPETRKRKFEGGMYILKPEEINKKSCENKLFLDQITQSSSQNNDSDPNQMDMDIEKFLATSEVCTLQDNDVYVISDDEDISCTPKEAWKNVWIACKNIENFGWIPGRKDNKNYLSFEFPGFKFTEFYPEIEAYNKIYQVLSRKVYVPKHVKLEWHYVESEADVKDLKKLDSKDLSSDFVLTNKGLRHMRLLLEKFKYLNSNPGVSNSSDECDSDEMVMNKKIRAMSALEETSTTLDEETNFLWDKTMLKKGEILESFSKTTEDLRMELNNKLNAIVSDSEMDNN